MDETVSGGQQQFRYPVAPLVKAKLTIGADGIEFRRGARHASVAAAEVRRFGVRDRGNPGFGMTTSQLLLLVERDQKLMLVKVAFTPRHDACQRALAALRERFPGADTTAMPWEQAAAALGVEPSGFGERLMNAKSFLGMIIIGASALTDGALNATSPSPSRGELMGRGIALLIAFVVGVTLIVRGWRASG